jgi:hypothetical protein
MTRAERVRRLLPGLWAGALLCVALLAAPAAFAALRVQDAGAVVARLFTQEAYLSLALGVACLLLERQAAATQEGSSRLSNAMVLALLALFCTVLGHFGLQPMMVAARAGEGGWTFGQLHAASLGLYGVKTLVVLALAWRAAGVAVTPGSGPSS